MTFNARISALNTVKGYALITSLVFLTILTTIGIFTLRNTALETIMSANNNKNAQALEAAEVTRKLTSQLIDSHVHNRGWPSIFGGAVDDELFGDAIGAGLTLVRNSGEDNPRNWYDSPFQTSSDFSLLDLSDVQVRYKRDISGGSTGFILQGSATVRKLRADIEAGSDNAMSSGYQGLGKSAAAGGGSIFFYVAATGQDPSGQATSHTAAAYRYIVRN